MALTVGSRIGLDGSSLDSLDAQLTLELRAPFSATLSRTGSAPAIPPELLGELCDGRGDGATARRRRHAKLILGLPFVALRPYGELVRDELLGLPVVQEDRVERMAARGILQICLGGRVNEAVEQLGLRAAVDKAIARQMSSIRQDRLRSPIPRAHHGLLSKLEYEEIESQAWSRQSKNFVVALCKKFGVADSRPVLDRFCSGVFQYPYLRGLFRLIGVDNKRYIADGRAVRLGDFYDARIAFYAPGLTAIVSEDQGLTERIALAFPAMPVWSVAEFVRFVRNS